MQRSCQGSTEVELVGIVRETSLHVVTSSDDPVDNNPNPSPSNPPHNDLSYPLTAHEHSRRPQK